MINKLFILDGEKRDAQKLLDDQSAKMNISFANWSKIWSVN